MRGINVPKCRPNALRLQVEVLSQDLDQPSLEIYFFSHHVQQASDSVHFTTTVTV